MTEERVLTEAQISLGVALPLHDRDARKLLFILLARGVPVAEVIDILTEIHGIEAPSQHHWEPVLPERTCKGCGTDFQPTSTNQTYHAASCRMDATARQQSEKTRQSHLAYVAALAAEAEPGFDPERICPAQIERECKGCGVTFQPRLTFQIYHDVVCRLDAVARNRRVKKETARENVRSPS